MRKFRDFTGERFSKLIVINLDHTKLFNGKKSFYWKCQCDCGNICIVQSSNLRAKHVKSCGCLYKEVNRSYMIKHNSLKTKEYKSWECMKSRCFNPNNWRYRHYGGRGITVCDKWKNSFSNFLKDMGNKPSSKYSIDRINTNGNYEPSNCRWTTITEQNYNKRNTVYLEYNNKTQTLKQWADELNIPISLIRNRYYGGLATNKILNEKINGEGINIVKRSTRFVKEQV